MSPSIAAHLSTNASALLALQRFKRKKMNIINEFLSLVTECELITLPLSSIFMSSCIKRVTKLKDPHAHTARTIDGHRLRNIEIKAAEQRVLFAGHTL